MNNFIGFFRHGRKLSNSTDSPLDTHGLMQAKQLISLVSGPLPKPLILWSSPKIRAQQTFEAVSSHLKLPLVVRKELEDRMSEESGPEFLNRLNIFLKEALQTAHQSGPLFLVSHFDWLESAMVALSADKTFEDELFDAGEYRIFKVDSQGYCEFFKRGVL